MKIRYLKKRLKYNLIFGILWSILGTIAFVFDTSSLLNFGYLAFGLIYLGTYFFEQNKQYLTIENGIITKNQIIPRQIKLDEIIHIKKLAGDYVLKTEQNELRITIDFIEKDSLLELETILEDLNLNGKEAPLNVLSNPL